MWHIVYNVHNMFSVNARVKYKYIFYFIMIFIDYHQMDFK